MTISENVYQIFKQKSTGSTIFSKGFASETDIYIAYKGGVNNAATAGVNVYLFESNKLMKCTSSDNNECTVTVREGLYYAANTKKIVGCDGKTCTEKRDTGIYYLKNLAEIYKIHKCNSATGTFTCSEDDAEDAAPTEVGHLKVQNNILQWFYNSAKDLIDPEDGKTTYLNLAGTTAHSYFSTGESNDIFIRIDKNSALNGMTL